MLNIVLAHVLGWSAIFEQLVSLPADLIRAL